MNNLRTPLSVRKLQQTLHAKAKGQPSYRFYSLYDKIRRRDVLAHAWERCRGNDGVAGVDGRTFADIEAEGVEGWLAEVAEDLKLRTYQPDAVRRVYIPKDDGKQQRPLGIPSIKDRVVQMAAVIVLEPIFEADLMEEQYAYRPERNAHQAIGRVHLWLNQGYREVVDCDLSGYFDSIPHPELLKSLARRISDGQVLKLLKGWLEMAVEETDAYGRKHRSTTNRDTRRGTPQGSPISPLLSNLYFRRFILGWKKLGWEKRLQARVVNYADDLVILCRGSAQKAEVEMRKLMTRLRLTVNDKKTRVCLVPEESFDFLGYTIGVCHKAKSGSAYIGTRPAKKRIQRISKKISRMTRPSTGQMEAAKMVGSLNRTLRGWANYFCLGPVSKAYRAVDSHTRYRLRHWLCKKHKQAGTGTRAFPDEYLYGKLGLLRLEKLTANLPWAKA
jgi:group II intron reverse transcriptase/maturase